MATIHAFGPFRLDADAEILFRGAVPTVLGQRAVALLRLLLERAGAPVSKDALIEAAWPGLAIEDSNLTVQIAALRRVFEQGADGADWIETLPRRGYRYVGPSVTTGDPSAEANRRTSPALALPDRPSVAVLPFSNLSGDPEQDYFADGMVEDIIAGLSRIKWLFVAAGSSSSDRGLDDIFTLQDEIALNVVGAIEPSLRRAEVERVKRKRPDSLDAYDLVLQAQADVYSGMPVQVTKALVLLQRALALDPTYALAHSFAAMCHHCLYLRAGLHEESKAASIRHAQAAILYGQDDALALTFAGFSIGMDGHDHAAAFTAFEAALAVSPSSALTYIMGSVIFGWAGEAERAIEWGERAMRLSPFDPWTWSAFHSLTLGYFHLGRYEAAAKAAHKAVQFNPGHSISYMLLAAPLAKLGRLEEAKAAAARVMELQPAFRYSRQFAGVDCAPALAATLSEALHAAGLPQ